MQEFGTCARCFCRCMMSCTSACSGLTSVAAPSSAFGRLLGDSDAAAVAPGGSSGSVPFRKSSVSAASLQQHNQTPSVFEFLHSILLPHMN